MNTDEKPVYKDEISPDSLMGDFRGTSVTTILIFTVIVHVVIIIGTSFGFLKSEVLGGDTAEMSKDDRVDAAVKEATVSIRDIAKKYELSPQEISDRFAKGGSRTDKVMSDKDPGMDDPADTPPPTPNTSPTPPETTGTPDKPLSDIEKKITETNQGPAVPDMDEKEDDDLF
jgi:hypothetical protein